MRIGLISDTHGLLRPQALDFLAGCDHILHAGDIGDPAILEALSALAPLTAVRGNNDQAAWALALPEFACLRLGEVSLCLFHDYAQCPPLADEVRVLVTGHSHRPLVRELDGILHVNPGSAGRRRFSLPVTAGELRIDAGRVTARIARLEGPEPEWLQHFNF
ncbi:MAG: hypothetical protein K0Q68_447 [Moraxellaceae bacterium]|jgi:putative phosphoesterase|nr:hypothetical protein [Moraxellaceae bacterium]